MSSKRAELNIIVATDKKHGYGKNGEIPWKLEHEFGYFLKMIENKAITVFTVYAGLPLLHMPDVFLTG